ncbi:protein-L-isoaspartate(D-aspartate) O-methyltransferase [Dasania sp. GY-MA-18]|uniref:Protein-L-isoaspartate O-methyltransferase n=1 Tax=Dasania phycosphaerae TaxID=2950436 RepID=A0A9J6RNC3_9GAMM|nr:MULTISPECIES: protein-L-isoaspartate(D-aspartate) O-methyltransferase [Dasania]MCR8923248.1 protein-L-isoaspartate(D-aspartate) O-methyltransferase [Dasania sp. GY-MA-18]MCZ0865680.1 protein-L-isoaspartate(D-aspartate) O-methyltransferase [Dasania phycosphaerae]MCZ0869405.1 protein-L-isoaspartate(D-aspartate) O-methyltransferase [Dasania phycosphaerae]
MNTEHTKSTMLNAIQQDIARTAHLTGVPQLDPRLIAALAQVPRQQFIGQGYQEQAYQNSPLPIGYGQTISQPYIVALMTQLLKPQPQHSVLEIGTGSGYQAAILAQLVKQVYSIELIAPLAEQAKSKFIALAYTNIISKCANGCSGWPKHAPYDAIIITAAGSIPPALVEQLKPGGRLVAPIKNADLSQDLITLDKNLKGEIKKQIRLAVSFVPLQGLAASN